METRILGRTGLEVTVMGIGTGRPSRIGQSAGKSDAESVTIIREALDAGVTFIDTAEAYRTEAIVGEAVRGRDRGSFVVSTKKSTDGQIRCRSGRSSWLPGAGWACCKPARCRLSVLPRGAWNARDPFRHRKS